MSSGNDLCKFDDHVLNGLESARTDIKYDYIRLIQEQSEHSLLSLNIHGYPAIFGFALDIAFSRDDLPAFGNLQNHPNHTKISQNRLQVLVCLDELVVLTGVKLMQISQFPKSKDLQHLGQTDVGKNNLGKNNFHYCI